AAVVACRPQWRPERFSTQHRSWPGGDDFPGQKPGYGLGARSSCWYTRNGYIWRFCKSRQQRSVHWRGQLRHDAGGTYADPRVLRNEACPQRYRNNESEVKWLSQAPRLSTKALRTTRTAF